MLVLAGQLALALAPVVARLQPEAAAAEKPVEQAEPQEGQWAVAAEQPAGQTGTKEGRRLAVAAEKPAG